MIDAGNRRAREEFDEGMMESSEEEDVIIDSGGDINAIPSLPKRHYRAAARKMPQRLFHTSAPPPDDTHPDDSQEDS